MHIALVFLLIASLPYVPGKMTPALTDMIADAPSGEKIYVIVHMSERYPFEMLDGMSYQDKGQVLKNIAKNSQEEIIDFLKTQPEEKAEIVKQFWVFNGFHAKATPEVIQELAQRDDVWYISDNVEIKLDYSDSKKIPSVNVAEWNIQRIMADSCWNAGFSGSGIIIGHVDTGVFTDHPALAGKWLSPWWLDGVNGQPAPYDDHNHGTHTMGTICGGDGFGPFVDDVGVAYGAQFVPTKAFNSGGSGSFGTIDPCMQYFVDIKVDSGVDIRAVSNSWGNSNGSELHWWDVVLTWKNIGIFPVWSNGNSGPSSGTVGAPASHPTTIGTGATDSGDNLASFSSRGPAPNIDPINDPTYWYYPTWSLLKPDVSAPGVSIRSSIASGGYGSMQGTSMAAPHVAGGTAIILERNPGLTPTDLYMLFINNCDEPAGGGPYPNNNYGWGRINLWTTLQNTPADQPAVPTYIYPLDYGRLPDLQPTLSFYSTDPNSDDIQYRVVWDTDPSFGSPDSGTTGLYGSGVIVTYTIPVPLTNGATYWWKIKATDPGGSGFWSQYTVPRSFTIGTSLPAASCSWYQNTNAQWVNDVFTQTFVEGDSVVLGGVVAYDTLLEEDFESGMPAGWTVVDGNSDGYMWTTGTTSDMGTYTPPGYGSAYAYYSDDDAGSGAINNNEELISPSIYSGGYTTLELVYGYGFRVYQTGEKYRVKIRTYNGGWSAWSDLTVYTSSGNGTEIIDISSYLPADSVQFDWFYSDSTSSSHWGWACSCDNILLRRGYLVVFDDGTVTGTDVVFNELSTTYSRIGWGDAVWTKAAAAESIGIQVEYYNGATWQLVPDGVLPGNSSGFFTTQVSDTVSINMLDTLTYHTLRLVGLLYRNATDPALLNWEVGNLANYVGVTENNGPKDISGSIFRIYPSITKSGLNITFAIGNPQGLVELSVYDAMGRKVKDLIENRRALTVFNEIYWNGTDDLGRKVAAGVYFVRYETEDFEKVEKAILVR